MRGEGGSVGKTTRQRIMASPAYAAGTRFTARQMAGWVNASRDAVESALATLRASHDVLTDGDGTYYKPKRHWIHSRRLAQPVED